MSASSLIVSAGDYATQASVKNIEATGEVSVSLIQYIAGSHEEMQARAEQAERRIIALQTELFFRRVAEQKDQKLLAAIAENAVIQRDW